MTARQTPDKSAQSDRQRLFFGLSVPDPQRRALRSVRDACTRHTGAHPVAAENFHLTLVFLGSTNAEQRHCIQRAATGITTPGFHIDIDHIGYWSRPQVLWAAPSVIPASLSKLVQGLQQHLVGCGFTPEQRRYRPHLTLARRVHAYTDDVSMEPLDWSVTHFHLYRSISTASGIRYRVIASWPLPGPFIRS